jgi:hypothetical protein
MQERGLFDIFPAGRLFIRAKIAGFTSNFLAVLTGWV